MSSKEEEPAPPGNDPTTDTSPATTGDEIANRAQAAYKWWDDLATLRADDPLWLGALKIGFRVVGIIVLIALSPLILLGLMMAFIAVA